MILLKMVTTAFFATIYVTKILPAALDKVFSLSYTVSEYHHKKLALASEFYRLIRYVQTYIRIV